MVRSIIGAEGGAEDATAILHPAPDALADGCGRTQARARSYALSCRGPADGPRSAVVETLRVDADQHLLARSHRTLDGLRARVADFRRRSNALRNVTAPVVGLQEETSSGVLGRWKSSVPNVGDEESNVASTCLVVDRAPSLELEIQVPQVLVGRHSSGPMAAWDESRRTIGSAQVLEIDVGGDDEDRKGDVIRQIDAFWERTDTWEVMRKIHQGFHGRYGDLFLNMAVTRVSFLPDGYGGGNVFEKDTSDVVGNVLAASDETIPLMISEFVDLEGRRYAMFVNLDRERSVFMGLRYPGEDVEIYAYRWNSGGEEYRWAADNAYGVPSPVQRRGDALIASYQLGPGDAFLQRVDSTQIRQSELTLEMRELSGLAPQEPLDVELARQALTRADNDEARQKAQAELDARLARHAANVEE